MELKEIVAAVFEKADILFSWQVECSHSPGTGKAMFKPLNTEHE
jgi:hypothetical protein